MESRTREGRGLSRHPDDGDVRSQRGWREDEDVGRAVGARSGSVLFYSRGQLESWMWMIVCGILLRTSSGKAVEADVVEGR